MPIITPPKIVHDALDEFLAPLFENTPQRKHLANYTTGLMISENKTVSGMTNEMPNASDQSCLAIDDRRELSSVVSGVVTESDRLGGRADGGGDAIGGGSDIGTEASVSSPWTLQRSIGKLWRAKIIPTRSVMYSVKRTVAKDQLKIH